ncbi:hypothetical protein BGX31_002415, partial [Mortierella sp. GBA43]
MFPDIEAMISGVRLQTFRKNRTADRVIVPTRWDPGTGQHVVYWEDIQQIFAGTRAVLNNGELVPFLENGNSEVLLPQRISHYPDSVLDVVAEDTTPTSTLDVQELRLKSPTRNAYHQLSTDDGRNHDDGTTNGTQDHLCDIKNASQVKSDDKPTFDNVNKTPSNNMQVLVSQQTCELDGNTSSLVQRLPDDILYHIINRGCCQDLSLLHTLIFVNKFCFRAALPLMWSTAIMMWRVNGCKPGAAMAREKLMVTMLVSFLEARLLEQDEQESQLPVQASSRRRTDAQRADEILEPFGLRISGRAQSPMLRLYLMDSVEAEEGQEDQMVCTHRKRRMTVDYSKHFNSLLCGVMGWIDFKHLVQLRILDDNYSDTSSDGGDMDINGINLNFNAEEEEPNLQVEDSFRKLLLHYNHETITDLPMYISDASKYLSLAPKMAKLRVLELDRSE